MVSNRKWYNSSIFMGALLILANAAAVAAVVSVLCR
jgi:hypothetical protein